MRLVALVVGFAAIALIALMAMGIVDLEMTEDGELPTVEVTGGQLPQIEGDVADVTIGSQQASVPVPEFDVRMEETEVEVPTIDFEEANVGGDEGSPNQ